MRIVGYETEFIVKGFIDDNISALDDFPGYYPRFYIKGSISEYKPSEDDVFVCSIGGRTRSKCIQSMDRGGEFILYSQNSNESVQM